MRYVKIIFCQRLLLIGVQLRLQWIKLDYLDCWSMDLNIEEEKKYRGKAAARLKTVFGQTDRGKEN